MMPTAVRIYVVDLCQSEGFESEERGEEKCGRDPRGMTF